MYNFQNFKKISGIARRHIAVRRTSGSAPTYHVFNVIDAEVSGKSHLWTESG